MKNTYVQLWSVREDLEKDYKGVLRQIASIGYSGVEFAGNYGGLSASALKELMRDLKLEALSAHVTSDNVAAFLDYAVELGLKYIIDPAAGIGNDEEAAAFAKKLNVAGKLCRDAGITFGYHNHRHEFVAGKDGTLYETLLKNTDPDLVCFQLDVGWSVCAGVDTPALIKKYPGRFKLIHVKECSTVAGPEGRHDFSQYPKDENGRLILPEELIRHFEEVNAYNVATGKGLIDWAVIKDVADAHGAEAYVMEREYVYAGDVYHCLVEDWEFMNNM